VGVPDKVPEFERVSPVGRLPFRSEKPYGVAPPLAVMFLTYGWPTVPPGSEPGDTLMFGQVT
jgi:hypothetical protein